MEHKVFIACDGDEIGKRVGKAGLADDIETMSRISNEINIAGTHAREWIESHGGRIIVLGGDEINAELPFDALEGLEEFRQLWSKYAHATLSIGIGDKISHAGIALVWAKLNGKDRIAMYDEEKAAEVLEQMKSKESETESEKLGNEYFKKHERLVDVLKSPSHEDDKKEAKTQEKELEGYKKEDKAETEVDYQFPEDLDDLEGEPKDNTDSNAPDKDKIRDMLGESLQNIKDKLPELAQIKESNPEAYQSMVDMINAVKEMVKAFLSDSGKPNNSYDDLDDYMIKKETNS